MTQTVTLLVRLDKLFHRIGYVDYLFAFLRCHLFYMGHPAHPYIGKPFDYTLRPHKGESAFFLFTLIVYLSAKRRVGVTLSSNLPSL